MFSTVPISVFSFLGIFLVLFLVPSYARAKNIPVLLSVFWLFLAGVCTGTNTAAWQGTTLVKWKPYCEVATRIIYGSPFALACCSILLLRRLEAIAATRCVSLTERDLRRRLILELSVGLLCPIIYTALSIVNQGHRFDIIENFGPNMPIFPSLLMIMLSTLPSLLASVIALVYAVLCARWLIVRRRQLNAALSSSGSGLNRSQFLRLFILTCMELLWTMPINVTVQMQNLFNRYGRGATLYPYTSWHDVHSNFGIIGQLSIEMLEATETGRRNLPIQYLGMMSIPVACFLYFAFLGTSSDVLKGFRETATTILTLSRQLLCGGTKCSTSNVSSAARSENRIHSFTSNDVSMQELKKETTDDSRIEILIEKQHVDSYNR